LDESVAGPDRLRVLTYNVRDLKDDLDALARVVRSIAPDVACLQEVPRLPFAGHRVGALADACGLLWSGGAEKTGGTAVFTSLRIDQRTSGAGQLPVSGLLARRRGYAAGVVGVPGGPSVTVASVHLSLVPEERVRHARLVRDRLRELGSAPYVVAGDLNEPPGGPAWMAFEADFHDAVRSPAVGEPTFPARAPRQRIDAVLVSEGLVVESIRVPGVADGVDPVDLAHASDHLPVVADLRIVCDRGQRSSL
jgi:endonuclease/exonuclease/phosphatase family metal-dependent hydrolase